MTSADGDPVLSHVPGTRVRVPPPDGTATTATQVSRPPRGVGQNSRALGSSKPRSAS